MKTKTTLSIAALLCILSPQLARAVSPSPAEMAEARRWATAKFEGVADAKGGPQGEPRPSVEPPFSFTYQGKPSADFLKHWRTERVSKKLSDGRTTRTTTYTDPATGLEVRCDAVEYGEYPAVEWILYFKNTGTKDTGIVENILPMDLSLTGGSSEFAVHHAKGTCCNIVDFQPIDDVLGANAKLQIQSSPWPSTTALPFFNVEWDGHGFIAGIGWTEGWAADFIRDGEKSLSVKVGPSLGHFVLHPGEQVRSLRMLVLFWNGDRIHGHNVWRQLLLKRFPNMFIDNCYGGGQNIDLETIRRSIALWRSDYQVNQNFDPIGMQGQTYGLSFWVPLSAGVIGDACHEAGVAKQPDAYAMRSGYSPALIVTWFGNDQTMPGDNFDYDTARRLLNEYVGVRKYFSGDYYPLTQYNLDAEQWMAWQFDRPDLGEGMVQAFRRGKSPYETATFRLRGLEPRAVYQLTNTDVAGTTEMTGRELLEVGLPIAVKTQPGAVVVTYKKKP